MTSLPQGWESDYDGTRWFFRHKSTGFTQYDFPKFGDESPESFDFLSPPPDLAPEEPLESDRQMKRSTIGDKTSRIAFHRAGATQSKSAASSAASLDGGMGFDPDTKAVQAREPTFPLHQVPRCRICDSPGTRIVVSPFNRNGNAGRSYYKCTQGSHSTQTFITFDDILGIDAGNPRCKCQFLSRCSRSIKRDGFREFYSCPVGKCNFVLWTPSMHETANRLARHGVSMLGVVMCLDLNGTIISVSPSWVDVIGTRPESVEGTAIADLIISDDKTVFSEIMKTMKEEDQYNYFVEFSMALGPLSKLPSSGLIKKHDTEARSEVLDLEGQGAIIRPLPGGDSYTEWNIQPRVDPQGPTTDHLNHSIVDKEGLTVGLHGFPQPLQEALAPFLEDELVWTQLEDQFKRLKHDPNLRQKSIMGLLNDLGPSQVEDDGRSAAKPEDGIKGNRSAGKEDSVSGVTVDLMAGLHSLPQPLLEAVAPFLEDETTWTQLEDRTNELKNNRFLRQKSVMSLLNELGSAGGTDDEDYDEPPNAAPQGGSNLPSSSPSRVGPSEGDASRQSLLPPEERASPEQGPVIETQPMIQPQTLDENFFDWSIFQSCTLPPKQDFLEIKYLAVLAIYEKVKVNFSAPGVGSIGLDGIAGLLRQWLHKDDILAFFRSVERVIRLPKDSSRDTSQKNLENLDTALFDTSKFSGFDTRLTSITYGDGKYGTITLFKLSTVNGRPSTIRPVAAMEGVPRIVLHKIGCGIRGSSRTTLFMPKHEIWEATKQTKIGRFGPLTALVSKPDFTRCSEGDWRIDEALRIALSMDDNSEGSFDATVPQMVAMLHHKTPLIENIQSTPVYLKPDGETCGVRMIVAPDTVGHGSHNPQIIVLAPARGGWVEEKMSWK